MIITRPKWHCPAQCYPEWQDGGVLMCRSAVTSHLFPPIYDSRSAAHLRGADQVDQCYGPPPSWPMWAGLAGAVVAGIAGYALGRR